MHTRLKKLYKNFLGGKRMLSREELIFMLIINCVRYILILIIYILVLIKFAMFGLKFFTKEKEKEIKKSYDLFLIVVRINIILICMSPFFYPLDEFLRNSLLENQSDEIVMIVIQILMIFCATMMRLKVKKA